jgi:hypothetical protein
MVISVSDARSNANDQIAHAAKVIGKSQRAKRVFEAIYHGKKKTKSVSEIAGVTRLSEWDVLTVGRRLANQHIVGQTKIDGKTAYEKDAFYSANKNRVLSLVKNPKSLARFPTKYSPKTSTVTTVIRTLTKPQIREITCDDFDDFVKVRRIRKAKLRRISEEGFQLGVQKLLGESGKFQDWGGEKNDLFTTKARIAGQRRTIAFAFKGPGTKGILTPRKLGKQGNQIQRLFLSPAEVFVVQYWGQIDQDVLEQMKAFATMNSIREGKPIWYGLIDGDDSNRLMKAYAAEFCVKKT